MSDWVLVAPMAALLPGEYKVVNADGAQIAVFNLDGEIYAIEDVCTHDGGQLTGGVIDHHQIECPRHGARFDIRSGEVLSAPAYEPVSTFPVKIDSGHVFVRDDRWD